MTPFAASLKSEIARVARKEIKVETEGLKKQSSGYRSDIAELKRQIKALTSTVKALQKAVESGKPAAVKSSKEGTDKGSAQGSDKAASQTQAAPKGRKPRNQFTGEAFAALRQKLDLTQAQMAQLIGSSSLSVSKWESGNVQPRAKQLEAINAVWKIGKREARRMLEAAVQASSKAAA